MPFVQAKCPECGGMLAVDADKKAAVCQFCGEPFIVQEAINNYNIYNTTNYNTTHQYGDGAVVNVYEDKSKDFVIEAGVLKEYHGESVDVVIPDNVKEIGYRCFCDKAIERVTIQEGVTEIGWEAFSSCRNLKYIDMPKSVIKIDSQAFERCSSLKNIEFSESITEIGTEAFRDCFSLTSIRLPNNTIIIDNFAFANCLNLTDVTLPDNLTMINDNVFENCKKLSNIKIPNDVTKIGACSFRNCENLSIICLPKSLKKISSYAFDGCKQLTQVIYDGSFIDWIQIQFFSNPNEIAKNLNVQGGLLDKHMVIPSEITEINLRAFEGIELNSVTISNKVKGFSNVTRAIGLQEIIVLYEDNNMKVSGLFPRKFGLDFPRKFGLDLVRQILISDTIDEIGDFAFQDLRELTSICIPENIKKIGKYAFAGCSKLVDVNLPDDVKIGEFAFSDYWKVKGLCPKCGGDFNVFKRCKNCGRKKDY